MRLKLARKVGFCFGVRRAVEMAEEVLKKEEKVYSLGSIIHNKQVVEDLSGRGLKVIKSIDDAGSGVLVISSHGIGPDLAGEISKRSLKLVDTTCPFVRNAQSSARSLGEEGYTVIIVGDVNHPEVKALYDFAGKKAHVVKDASGLKALKLKPNERIGILSQTTQSMNNFLGVVKAIIGAKPESLRVLISVGVVSNITKMGWHRVPVTEKNIESPFNLSVIKIDPLSIQVQIIKKDFSAPPNK